MGDALVLQGFEDHHAEDEGTQDLRGGVAVGEAVSEGVALIGLRHRRGDGAQQPLSDHGHHNDQQNGEQDGGDAVHGLSGVGQEEVGHNIE